MSKKNLILIIGLASLALIFLSFVVYVAKKTNEKNAEIRRTNEREKEINENFDEMQAELKEKEPEIEAELDLKYKMLRDNGNKIKSLICFFQKKFGIDEKNKLIMSNQEIRIGIQKITTNETSLKTLGNFLGELNVHLKKFNEIKYDFSEIQKKIDEQLMKISLGSEMQGTLQEQEFQENFNKIKENFNSQIKKTSKISFSNPEQDKLHDLLIIQNEELIINPEISKCFTTKQLNIINKSKEEAEKNLNPPSTIIQGNNVEESQKQEIPKNK